MLFLECQPELVTLVRLVRQGLIPLIQIGIPIILIILGMIDLGKAVMASKEDEIKSAQKLLIKRAIYAVAIFFIVLIVQLVFGLLASTGDTSIENAGNNWKECWDAAGK